MAGPEGKRPTPQTEAQRRRERMREAIAPHLAGAIQGDVVATAEVFRAIQPGISSFIRGSWSPDYPPVDADDIAQETYVGIAQALPTLEDQGPDAFIGFCYRVARNKTVDAGRARGRDLARRIDEPTRDVPYEENYSLDPALRATLKEALVSLPESQQNAIALTILAGFDAETAAKVLGKTSGNVRVAQHRGLKKLQERIPEDKLEGYRELLGGRSSREDEPEREREQDDPAREQGGKENERATKDPVAPVKFVQPVTEHGQADDQGQDRDEHEDPGATRETGETASERETGQQAPRDKTSFRTEADEPDPANVDDQDPERDRDSKEQPGSTQAPVAPVIFKAPEPARGADSGKDQGNEGGRRETGEHPSERETKEQKDEATRREQASKERDGGPGARKDSGERQEEEPERRARPRSRDRESFRERADEPVPSEDEPERHGPDRNERDEPPSMEPER